MKNAKRLFFPLLLVALLMIGFVPQAASAADLFGEAKPRCRGLFCLDIL